MKDVLSILKWTVNYLSCFKHYKHCLYLWHDPCSHSVSTRSLPNTYDDPQVWPQNPVHIITWPASGLSLWKFCRFWFSFFIRITQDFWGFLDLKVLKIESFVSSSLMLKNFHTNNMCVCGCLCTVCATCMHLCVCVCVNTWAQVRVQVSSAQVRVESRVLKIRTRVLQHCHMSSDCW